MGWPQEAFLHLRQILSPSSRPQTGGNLLYVKDDNGLYLMDANGTERAVSADVTAADLAAHIADTTTHGTAGAIVGTSDTQALTNKDLTSGTNTFPSSLATDAEVTSAVSTHAALTATHGATGAVVGTTNTQTLTNKTLTAPRVNEILDTDGEKVLHIDNTGSGNVNFVGVSAAPTGSAAQVYAQGSDSNVNLSLEPKGTGDVLVSGIALQPRTRGQVTGTTDASGDITITHDLGTTPTAVLVTSGRSDGNRQIVAHTFTSTTFKARTRVANTAAIVASTPGEIIYWEAIA